MNVRWTERASKDALGIYDFIADQSEAYAESVYARIIVRPEQLERFPDSGSIVDSNASRNRMAASELFSAIHCEWLAF